TREAHYQIDSIYTERWSPRAFSNKPIEDEKINSVLEAARWAPSAANWQPWRFIVAKTKEDRERFLSFNNENNVEWCKEAPVLGVSASKKTRNEEGAPNLFHAFDTGTAWGYLTLEAYRQGLITHGMGGFNPESAREELQIPDEYDIQAVFAMGYHDPEASLSERNRQREIPSGRIPMKELMSEGYFVEK